MATLSIPPPRLHRHRYHGVLAPNAPQRVKVIALARQLGADWVVLQGDTQAAVFGRSVFFERLDPESQQEL